MRPQVIRSLLLSEGLLLGGAEIRGGPRRAAGALSHVAANENLWQEIVLGSNECRVTEEAGYECLQFLGSLCICGILVIKLTSVQ